jgi:membrane-associated phospholipid phosphatase
MPDFLLQLDRHLFYFINHDLTNPFFDWVMPWLRNAKHWVPLYVFLIGFFIWKLRKQALLLIIIMALCAGFADFTSSSLIKPIFKRARPCRDPIVSKTDIERVDCGPAYSFPSTHATDHFAAAFFLIFLFYKRWHWILLWGTLWAGTISFAQVYVGVHFPIDVFCGAVYGMLVGFMFVRAYKKVTETELYGKYISNEAIL